MKPWVRQTSVVLLQWSKVSDFFCVSEQAVHKAPGGWFVAFGQAARPNEQTSQWLVCEAVRVAAGYAGQFLQNEESVSDSYALPLPSLVTELTTS